MALCVVFFFKQKTAYEMRISDWSSDVCSSDLLLFRAATDHGHHLNLTAVRYLVEGQHRHIRQMLAQELEQRPAHERRRNHSKSRAICEQRLGGFAKRRQAALRTPRVQRIGEMGRASCRERGGQYG